MYSFFDFIDYTCLLIALYTTSTLYIQISIELYTDYLRIHFTIFIEQKPCWDREKEDFTEFVDGLEMRNYCWQTLDK